MGSDTTLVERTVRHAEFVFTNQDGKKQRVRRGTTLKLSPEDVARGEKINAFLPVDLDPVDETPTIVELVDWISKDKPTVKAVIERSNGDLETAQLLIKAEKEATGNDPRKGVVEGLAQVISAANE